MIVTIHQPNLFPWIGFFDKMVCSDLFILLDNVPYTKRGFQNRVQLKGPNGPQWLTLPVNTKGKHATQLTYEVEISSTLDWKREHLKTYELLYRKSPNYGTLYPRLEALYNQPYSTLCEFTVPGIQWMKELLSIQTPLVYASDLGVSGQSSHLLCDLVKSVGGSTYLSGPSGRHYLDEQVFLQEGVKVEYHTFEVFEYPQRFGGFAGGLSTLDYLFNTPGTGLWNRRNTA